MTDQATRAAALLAAAIVADRDADIASAVARAHALVLERQRLLLSWHPEEFVVLYQDRFIAATRDEDAAFSAFDAAPEGAIVVPPEPERFWRAPPARGRGPRPRGAP